MDWSFTAFHTLHVVIYMTTLAEYFWLEREIQGLVTAVGLLIFTVALAVRLTAIRALGGFWSLHLEIRAEHKLVTRGIYRYMRHPAYAAIMLEVVSIPLVANSYYTLGLALGAYVPLLLVRWSREEREMVAKFGEEYTRYCREVPAFWPRWGVGTRQTQR